jgi:hypothetical protein
MRLLIAVPLIAFTVSLGAEPKYQAQLEGIKVLLHSDKCELTKEITNLPFKAEWSEKGQVLQGCWKPNGEVGTVDFYFQDKTAFSMPAQMFRKVTGV